MDKDVFDENKNYKQVNLLKQINSRSGLLGETSASESPAVDVVPPLSDKSRNGSPYDRGSADAYYSRAFDPHYFVGNTYMSDRISKSDMTPEQIAEYREGYEQEGSRKDWGE